MTQHIFSLIAAVFFLLIAVCHIVRIAFDVTFVVEGISVPMWASGLAAVVMGYLAYQGFRIARTTHS